MKMKEQIHTKIWFEHEKGSKTSMLVKRGKETIGRVWSQQSDGWTPFPHNKDAYCFNSVQICGFDRMSEVWACGPFDGKKDCVIHFLPTEHKYYVESAFKTKQTMLSPDKRISGKAVQG